MESFATPYAVLFYDGEQELDKGHIGVHSVLTFKRFQALVAQKTGIAANQLSAVFVCRRTLKETEKRQKLPINENTNFNIILNQHNPSRERDCHFLVSIKKSKKERKGTRKRSAEADNAEDDDSTSSRGDLSPSDERPKAGGNGEENLSPEANSPRSYVQKTLMLAMMPTSSETSHTANGNGAPAGKLSSGAVPDYKAERTLLRREGAGQNGFASPRSGWPSESPIRQRVSGFSVSLGATAKMEGQKNQTSDKSTRQQEDRRNEDGNKHWRQPASATTVEDDGMTTPMRALTEKTAHAAGQPQRQPASGMHLFQQDRFNDATSQGHGGRPPTAFGAGRGNALLVGIQSPSTMSSTSPDARQTDLRLISTSAAATAIPRLSMGGLAAVASSTGGITLQQAQDHISHLQHQHLLLAGAISQVELSKLNGMLRGLVARDSRGGENAKLCKFCCLLRERNMGPPPFHWCVDDAITKGFSGPSPAGPIGRPGKRHVEAAA